MAKNILQASCFVIVLAASATISSESIVITPELENIRSQYASLESVYLRVSGIVSHPEAQNEKNTLAGSTTYEYWDDGTRYRIRTTSDPTLGLANSDIAFDGQESQYLDSSFSPKGPILHLYSSEVEGLPTAMLNPLFMPVSFLNVEDARCLACRRSPKNLSQESLWQERLALASVDTLGSEISVTVPGVWHGRDIDRVLAFDTDGRISSIHLNAIGGDGIGLVEFSAYEDFGNGDAFLTFPRRISATTFDPEKASRETSRMELVVEELRINTTLGSEIFTIDRGQAAFIYDEDSATFLKSPEDNLE